MYPNMPHVKPATRNPIGGAMRNPPIAVNSINDAINKFAKVGLVNFKPIALNIFFIVYNLAHNCDIR